MISLEFQQEKGRFKVIYFSGPSNIGVHIYSIVHKRLNRNNCFKKSKAIKNSLNDMKIDIHISQFRVYLNIPGMV